MSFIVKQCSGYTYAGFYAVINSLSGYTYELWGFDGILIVFLLQLFSGRDTMARPGLGRGGKLFKLSLCNCIWNCGEDILPRSAVIMITLMMLMMIIRTHSIMLRCFIVTNKKKNIFTYGLAITKLSVALWHRCIRRMRQFPVLGLNFSLS